MLKLSILAVDDSAVITEMIKDAFEDEGYRVLVAGDGIEALKTALEENPDLIIADIAMPGMDGWELCSQIRSNPYTSFIPFIFLTSRTDAPDRIRGIQMGADDYLTKPFDMEELIARVNLIFQRIRKTQEAMFAGQNKKTLSGSTSEMALPDLLQMFGLNQKTGTLRISKMGFPTGTINMENGTIVGAELGKAKGQKAIFRLLEWHDAQFEVAPLANFGGEGGALGKVEEILMEGMRQGDEMAELKRDYPLAGKTLSVENRPGESELSPREADLLDAVAKHPKFEAILDELGWTDFEIHRMAVYFIRKGVIVAR